MANPNVLWLKVENDYGSGYKNCVGKSSTIVAYYYQ